MHSFDYHSASAYYTWLKYFQIRTSYQPRFSLRTLTLSGNKLDHQLRSIYPYLTSRKKLLSYPIKHNYMTELSRIN
jgi:hypothetical protein